SSRAAWCRGIASASRVEPKQCSERSVPAIEVEAVERERIIAVRVEAISAFIAGFADEAAHPLVMLAVWIGKLAARSAELVLELLLRVAELPPQLVVGQRRQVRVRDAVGVDGDSTLGVLSELVPGHRRELLRIVAVKLRDRERRAAVCEPRADEDLNRHAESL